MGKSKEISHDLSHIFKYVGVCEQINSSKEMSRDEKREAKYDFVRKFWEENRDNPVILDILRDLSKEIEFHLRLKSGRLRTAHEYRLAAYDRIIKQLPFFEYGKVNIRTFFRKHIKGAMHDEDRKHNSAMGVSKDIVKVLVSIPKIEQKIGERFKFTNPGHVQYLRDMGFSDRIIEKAELIAAFPREPSIDIAISTSRTIGEYDALLPPPFLDNILDALSDYSLAPDVLADKEDFIERVYELLDNENLRGRSVALNNPDRDYRYIYGEVVIRGRKLRELADEIGVSESMVSQIIKSINEYLREELEDEIDCSYEM